MSQHDLSIANQGFPSFRSDLNDALQALGTNSSGATAPATTYANQLWYDTANNILKIRNEDNDAWISIATLDQSADTLTAIGGKTLPSGTIVGTSDTQAFTNKTFTDGTTIEGLTVGRGAGAVSTNTVVGASALAANTSGSESVGLGYQALQANTTGYSLVAVGYTALKANTTGTNQVAVGRNALLVNTTGSNNTALGDQALQANTTASNNTAVGYQAGYTNTTGAFNTFVGQQAGYTATGGLNTFVGVQSGYTVTTGTKNSILGGYNGNQGGLDIRTASNNIVLSDGDGNPRMRADSNGQFYSLITGVGLYADYGCRAWVNFDGTGTVAIRGSGNVSSISDIGTGLYRINFATSMPDTNFTAVGNCAQTDSNQDGTYGDFITFYSYDVTDVNISTCNDSSTVMNLADMVSVTAAIFR